jgi:hypothetical protein
MAKPEDREAVEGTQYQGEDEIIGYTLDVTNIGGPPTSTSAKVFSVVGATYTDVTSTNMPTGSTSVTGNVITLPALKLLDDGVLYRVEVKFTIDGNVFEHFFEVQGQR